MNAYRKGVGIFLLNKSNKLWVGKRIDYKNNYWQMPQGGIDDSESEKQAMKRELGEEAGYKASDWDSLGQMLPCPGYSDEIIHLFLARGLHLLIEKPAGDDDEDLEVLEMSTSELDERISSGEEALDGKSVTAWYRARQFLQI